MANTDWMADIADKKYLSQLAIPGTHDSGACVATKVPMTRAQNLSISEQLAAGVRALDIRCAATWTSIFSSTYDVFHGPIDQGILVETVMQNVADFLKAHTGEVVLVLLKQESGKADISADINKIVNDTLGDTLLERDSDWRRWPRLGECRGKALVLSRLANPSAKHFSTVGWPDDCTNGKIWCRKDYYGVRLQDLYNSPEVEDKQKAVKNFLGAAKFEALGDNSTNLFLNFTSFVWKLKEPVWTAGTYMTPFLKQQNTGAGVICVDDVDEALATHIISMNG